MTLEELNRTSPFHAGAENTAFAPYFDGASYLNMLSTQGVAIGNVTFAPGCRNNWHIHHASKGGGQILLCTGGLLPLDGGGIRSGAKLPGRSVPATW